MNVSIRELNLSDIENHKKEIAAYLQQDFEKTYGRQTDEKYISVKIASLKNNLRNGTAFPMGAFYDGEMVGFLWGYLVDGVFEKNFHIAYIAVNESKKRNGIGKSLIEAVNLIVAEMDCAEHIELIVGANNKEAVEFYISQGFYLHREILRKKVRIT